MSDLRQCDCGGEGKMLSECTAGEGVNAFGGFGVRCEKCGTETDLYSTRQEVFKAWNRKEFTYEWIGTSRGTSVADVGCAAVTVSLPEMQSCAGQRREKL